MFSSNKSRKRGQDEISRSNADRDNQTAKRGIGATSASLFQSVSSNSKKRGFASISGVDQSSSNKRSLIMWQKALLEGLAPVDPDCKHSSYLRYLFTQSNADSRVLRYLCRYMNSEAVNLFLSVLPNHEARVRAVSTTNNHNINAYHIAARVGDIEILEILLSVIEDDELRETALMAQHKTQTVSPLHIVAYHGTAQMLSLILSAFSSNANKLAAVQTCYIDRIKRKTVMHIACQQGDDAKMQAILRAFPSNQDKQAIILKSDENQRTAMHLACAHGDVHMLFHMLASLENDEVRLRLITTADSHELQSPFHLACISHKPRMIKLLLENFHHDARLQREVILDKDVNGYNAVHLVCQFGDVETLRYLLDKLGDMAHDVILAPIISPWDEEETSLVKVISENEYSTEDFSINENRRQILQCLLERCPDLSVTDSVYASLFDQDNSDSDSRHDDSMLEDEHLRTQLTALRLQDDNADNDTLRSKSPIEKSNAIEDSEDDSPEQAETNMRYGMTSNTCW